MTTVVVMQREDRERVREAVACLGGLPTRLEGLVGEVLERAGREFPAVCRSRVAHGAHNPVAVSCDGTVGIDRIYAGRREP